MINVVLFIQENKFLHQIYRGMSYVFKVIPFYLLEERLIDDLEPSLKPMLENYTVRILSQSEVKELAANPETRSTWELFLDKIKCGYQCMGLLHDGQVVAYSWFNLNRCQYQNFGFQLNGNEAYLCDARTFQKYRGKNIAPYLRYQIYKELARLGRSKFYSFTIGVNKSSVRFKEKLGAKPLKLYLYIELFKKHRFVLPVKKIKV